MVAIACTTPPDGYDRWTLDLLTEETQKQLCVFIGRTEIWKVCLRNDIKHWRGGEMWVISEITPEFEKHMFDVLGVYERPFNQKYPIICIDKISRQLLKEIRKSLAVHPGKLKRFDYEYERNGTLNLFVVIEPKGKKRYVFVTKHRKKKDFAKVVKKLEKKKANGLQEKLSGIIYPNTEAG